MKKYVPTILAAGLAVVTVISGDVQAAIASSVHAHPAVWTSIGSIAAVVYHWLPSPLQGGK